MKEGAVQGMAAQNAEIVHAARGPTRRRIVLGNSGLQQVKKQHRKGRVESTHLAAVGDVHSYHAQGSHHRTIVFHQNVVLCRAGQQAQHACRACRGHAPGPTAFAKASQGGSGK